MRLAACRPASNTIVKRDTLRSEIGGDDGIRTHDLLSAIQALFRAELRPHLRGAYLNRTKNLYRKSDAQGSPGNGGTWRTARTTAQMVTWAARASTKPRSCH